MRISDWSSDVCSSDLVQTIGRAARNVDGRVILYADRVTGSMERALRETDRRREKQHEYNEAHGITPTTIKRNIADVLADVSQRDSVVIDTGDEDVPHLVGHNQIGRASCRERVGQYV